MRMETGRYASKMREWWRRFAYQTAKCSGLLYLIWPTFDFVAGNIQRSRKEMREPGNVTIGELDMESRTARLIVPGVDSRGVRLFVDAAVI